MSSNDRKLYDLCRKYQYYWKGCREFEKLDKVYWDKNIEKAFVDCQKKLENVVNDIEYEMAKRMGLLNEGSNYKIANNDEPINCNHSYSVMIKRPKSVEVYSDRFANRFQEMMNRFFKEKGMW